MSPKHCCALFPVHHKHRYRNILLPVMLPWITCLKRCLPDFFTVLYCFSLKFPIFVIDKYIHLSYIRNLTQLVSSGHFLAHGHFAEIGYNLYIKVGIFQNILCFVCKIPFPVSSVAFFHWSCTLSENLQKVSACPLWLTPMHLMTLQVCREYQRGNCNRGENDCRFAHPADSTMIDTNDNTVTVCMDYIKGRCSREKCKYFHPPAHLQAKIKAAQYQVNQAAAAQAAATAAAMVSRHVSSLLVSKVNKYIWLQALHLLTCFFFGWIYVCSGIPDNAYWSYCSQKWG